MLRILTRSKSLAFRRSFLGAQLTVLPEQRRDMATGLLTGLSDNYIKVLAKGSDELMNCLVPMKIQRIDEEGTWGRPIWAGEN